MIPLILVSGTRAIALAVALLFWVASRRLDRWGYSRVKLVVMMIVGVTTLTIGCLFIQILRDDSVPAPVPLLYRVAAGLLPLCLMAGAFLPSPKLFLIVAAVAPLAGVVAGSTAGYLNTKYYSTLPKSKEQIELEALGARRNVDFQAIPLSAGLAPLLPFVAPNEPFELRGKAMARIENTPDWIAQLSAMLDGEHRLIALYVLTQRVSRLPDDVVDRCWTASALIARNLTECMKAGDVPPESGNRLLNDSVETLGTESASAPQHHAKEVAIVRDFLASAKSAVGTSKLDFWIRQSQLQRIPDAAGVEALLEFAGPGEAWDVRQEAAARISKLPDSSAKLAKLLDTPRRLDVLAVLLEQPGQLPDDLREWCWGAAAITAHDMAKAIKHGNPPAQTEVRKLRTAVSLLWGKLGPVQERRLADLAAIREVVQAVGDKWDKMDFLWADAFLPPPPPPSAGGPKQLLGGHRPGRLASRDAPVCDIPVSVVNDALLRRKQQGISRLTPTM